MNRRDPGFDVWVVAADVLVGFLCVVFFLFVIYVEPADYRSPGPVGYQPPDEVRQFKEEIETHKAASGGKFDIRSEFSKVHLIYREKLLFQKCQWNLSTEGRKFLEEHFHILQKYAEAISRIQIEGHADRRSPKNCETLQQVGLRRDNWILSSLRALEVRDLLETIIKQDLEKTSEGASRGLQAALPQKLEAVGRGDLHPINPVDPDDEANRRIEITVHFIEQRAPEAGPPPWTETGS